MLTTVEGVYREGRVELLEQPDAEPGSKVIVTFLSGSSPIDLRDRGISPGEAADLRARLSAFAPDWDRPEMDIYDAI